MDGNSIKQLIAVLTIILLGAITNVAQMVLNSQKKIGAGILFANVISACFGGIIFGLVAKVMIDNIIWIMIAAGIGGYAGVSGLNAIKDTIIDFLVGLIKKKQG